MNDFSLNKTLMGFAGTQWTIGDAVEGVQIFGGIGSGKTSGSGRTIALRYLKAGFGGLVLTVKPDERELWESYLDQAGRSQDLIIVGPGQKNYFNFLDYEGKDSPTENIVQVLKTVIRANAEKSTGKSDDPFWETALDMLIFHVIDLCRLAYGKVSVRHMFDIVESLPGAEKDRVQAEDSAFWQAVTAAKNNVARQRRIWAEGQSPETLMALMEDESETDQAFCQDNADARTLRDIDHFLGDTYYNLSEKTRSIIDFSFSGFLFRLLREPVYSLFCHHPTTFTPEDCLDGKIIVLDLPVKIYHKAGQDIQIMFKYIWQRAMERRKVDPETSRPVFLWADEAQNFLHEYDADYQATARSSKIATVYISQNLPNYHTNMGGHKSEYRVKSFLGTLNTKFFHANADIETNRYASELIGEGFFIDPSKTINVAQKFSFSRSKSLRLDKLVRPEAFPLLKTGGLRNGWETQAYVHLQGKILNNNRNWKKIFFNQINPEQ